MAERTLLLAEDDPNIRRLLEVTLRRQGFEVTAVEDGVEACERLAERTFDVIVVDGLMPRMDGIDVCRRVKGDPRTAGIPVVMLTARTSLADDQEVRDAGVAACLSKPCDLRTLGDRLRAMCGHSPAADGRPPAGHPGDGTLRRD